MTRVYGLDIELLLLLIPTILAVSLTPGMCMTLAFSMGLTQGYRKTLWMMAGEMTGVALVVSVAFFIITGLLTIDPIYFNTLTVIGAAYLLWVAWHLWHAESRFGTRRVTGSIHPRSLLMLGFGTAFMNPKGWGFMFALLPGFIDPDRSRGTQLGVLLGVVLTTEFLSMSLYATGGHWLAEKLGDDHNLAILNKVAAALMVGVAVLVML